MQCTCVQYSKCYKAATILESFGDDDDDGDDDVLFVIRSEIFKSLQHVGPLPIVVWDS